MICNIDADLYLFGGDLIGIHTRKYFTIQDVRDSFSIFDNKNCIAIYGNHEYKPDNSLSPEDKIEMFKNMGFKILEDSEYVYKKDDIEFSIYGLKTTNYNDIKEINKKYDLVLCHETDATDNIKNQSIICGHTHAGQVKIPLLPIYIRPRNGKKYRYGIYENNKTNSNILVSSGLGFGGLKIRFNTRREILVIDYKKGI